MKFNHLFNNYPLFSYSCVCMQRFCCCWCCCRRCRAVCVCVCVYVYFSFPEVRRLKHSVDIDFYFWLINFKCSVNKPIFFLHPETQLRVKGYWTSHFYSHLVHSNLDDQLLLNWCVCVVCALCMHFIELSLNVYL